MNTAIRLLIPLLLLGAGPALPGEPEDGSVPGENASATAPEASVTMTLEVPLASPYFADTPVAIVDEEPITVADLARQIASIHAEKAVEPNIARKNYVNLLNRVINTKLIVQEARNIGFDETPEFQSIVETFSTQRLISILMSRHLQSFEPDPKKISALYHEMSREFLITTLKFSNRDDAAAFSEEYADGADFADLAKRFIDDRRAEGDLQVEEYLKLKDLLPRIGQTVYDMKPKSVSEVFSMGGSFVIFRVDDVRFYEDPEIEEEARRKLLDQMNREKGREYGELLIAKYATVDRKLLEDVDFESEKTGILWARKETPVDLDDLVDDERVVATIPGEETFTVTIGDLARKVRDSFYHGIETSSRKKKTLNQEKELALQNILFKRAAVAEARSQGLDETDEYVDAVDRYTDSLLFEAFLKRVVIPDVKIDEEEVRARYQQHIDDYSTPKMLRMDGIAFYEESDADKALEKLRKGADFKWVSANSPGQITKGTAGVTFFDNVLLSATALPEPLRDAAADARVGDSLVYADPGGHHHVIVVSAVFPSKPRPYEDARLEIAKAIFDEKTKQLVDEWSDKLKKEYETQIFVTGFEN